MSNEQRTHNSWQPFSHSFHVPLFYLQSSMTTRHGKQKIAAVCDVLHSMFLLVYFSQIAFRSYYLVSKANFIKQISKTKMQSIAMELLQFSFPLGVDSTLHDWKWICSSGFQYRHIPMCLKLKSYVSSTMRSPSPHHRKKMKTERKKEKKNMRTQYSFEGFS